ncbi:hypothetical protein JL720_9066 [Aureococcus anophagefferens]|nr:hypothetical protein JL720_9066 [Aureococcus anophagefferens]
MAGSWPCVSEVCSSGPEAREEVVDGARCAREDGHGLANISRIAAHSFDSHGSREHVDLTEASAQPRAKAPGAGQRTSHSSPHLDAHHARRRARARGGGGERLPGAATATRSLHRPLAARPAHAFAGRRRAAPLGALRRDGETCEDLAAREELERTTFTPGALAYAFAGLAVLFLLAETASQGADVTLNTVFASLPSVDPKEIINGVADEVEKLGPLGPLYFSVVYVLAEVLALPAVPLTASAGYLFGAVEGTAVVLFSATIAAGASFLIGRSLLRKWVEGIAAESEQFQAIDRAVAAEGFKIILLLRLSPIFPFALSNYFYGLTAVEFGPYLAATLLGFAPGTFLYVYSGEVASLVTAAPDDGGGAPFPWYFYAGFLSVGAFIAVKVTEVATAALEESSGIVKEDA